MKDNTDFNQATNESQVADEALDAVAGGANKDQRPRCPICNDFHRGIVFCDATAIYGRVYQCMGCKTLYACGADGTTFPVEQ